MKIFLSHSKQLKDRQLIQNALEVLENGGSVEHVLPKKVQGTLSDYYEAVKERVKLSIYKRELKRTQQELAKLGVEQDNPPRIISIEGFGYPVFHVTDQSALALREKEKELSELIFLYESYLTTGLDLYKDFIQTFEIKPPHTGMTASEFYEFITEVSLLDTSGSLKQSFFVRQLRKMMGTRIIPLQLDLRYLFRSIIKFLFKNMDDESGDSLNAQPIARIQQIVSHNSYIYELRRNSFSIQRAAW